MNFNLAMMKIHYLQHVPFEGLGSIENWIKGRRHTYTCTRFYLGDHAPEVSAIDGLIIMGGPMNIYETDRYPWLADEMAYIKSVIDRGLPVLGICLGAQLIARALGAQVTRNAQKEIGWFPVFRAPELAGHDLDRVFPEVIEVFHWHGDTFELPDGSTRIAGSRACRNQGFVYRDRVIGLQFHLESTVAGVRDLIDHCGDELSDAPYVQSPGIMLSDGGRFRKVNELMTRLLDHLASQETIQK